jgi:hypothetical protein
MSREAVHGIIENTSSVTELLNPEIINQRYTHIGDSANNGGG